MISPSQMSVGTQYQCYTRKEIDDYVSTIKMSINNGNYTVTKRKNDTNKNFAFITKYELKPNEIKAILLNIQTDDFCHTMLDDHNLTEVLYVFARDENLWNPEKDDNEQVLIYIKTCYKQDSGFTVVVSFHEAEYAVKYAFK